MTTTPALGADIDLRALFEKLTAAKYLPQVARGLHLKNPDGSFQVSSIEMEFRAWQDGYRAAFAAVPASEPVNFPFPSLRLSVALGGADIQALTQYSYDLKAWARSAAAPAPVSGMPDLARLTAAQREEFIRQVVNYVAEMDRDSPEDQPEMMLVTPEELRGCLESAFERMDEECTLCNGMGMLDGSGATCPHCNGEGSEPVAAPLPEAPAPTAPSTLGQQVARAKAEMATWSPELRASVRLEGGDAAAPTEQAGDVSFCTNGGTPMATYTPAKLDQDWEQAGELPPLPEPLDEVRCMIRGEQDYSTPCGDYFTDAQMRNYGKACALAARQADPSAAAIRITNKQQADPKLAGPGATAHERFLLAQLGWLQSAVLAARPAPTEAPKGE